MADVTVDVLGENAVAKAVVEINGFRDEAQAARDVAIGAAGSAVAATDVTIVNGDPTSTGFDTLVAHNRSSVTYAEAGAGTNNIIFPIPDRAEGLSLTLLYCFTGHAGAAPFTRTQHTDSGLGATMALIADGQMRTATLTVPAGKTAKAVWIGVTGVCSGDLWLAVNDGATTKAAAVAAQQAAGYRGAVMTLAAEQLAMRGGAGVSAQQLRDWAQSEAFEATAITWAGSIVSTATVKWPDGSAGVLTVTASSAGGVDAYTITHAASGLTVTQPAVTRNSAGAVTVKPALTVA